MKNLWISEKHTDLSRILWVLSWTLIFCWNQQQHSSVLWTEVTVSVGGNFVATVSSALNLVAATNGPSDLVSMTSMILPLLSCFEHSLECETRDCHRPLDFSVALSRDTIILQFIESNHLTTQFILIKGQLLCQLIV